MKVLSADWLYIVSLHDIVIFKKRFRSRSMLATRKCTLTTYHEKQKQDERRTPTAT